MVPRPCNTRYLKIIFDFATIFNFKYFRAGWLCAKIVSAFAQAAMKFVLRMLSLFWMMVLKLVVISTYVEHVGKLVTRCLSMHKNWLLVCRACAKIGCLLAEHARKLVTRQLSICENHFNTLRICFHSFSFVPSIPPFLCPLLPSLSMSYVPVSVLCLVFCPMALSYISVPVLCPLSHVSVPCLLSAVPSLTSLILVSHPLSAVSRLCSLSPILCTLSHVICPLSPILLSQSPHPHQLPSVPFSVALFHCFCHSTCIHLGLGTEFRSEKIPRNRLGMVSVIPRKKVLIPRHSEFRGRANSEARNGTKRTGIPQKIKFYGTV